MDCYGTPGHVGQWDCVVSCFFLDTAPNVLEYVELIHRLLAPGGVWIHLGPLQWHWESPGGGNESSAADCQDERYGRAIEMGYDDLHECIKAAGFECDRMERLDNLLYSCNVRSLMHTVFDGVWATYVKPKKADG